MTTTSSPSLTVASSAFEQPLHPAHRDHDLGLGVVPVAGPLGGEVGDRGAQVVVAGERQPAVRFGGLQALGGDADGLGRERQVGVEVLHPQDRPVGIRLRGTVGRGGDAVDAEAANGFEASRARDHAAYSMSAEEGRLDCSAKFA